MNFILIISFAAIIIVNVLAYFWAYKHQSDHLTDISYSACFVILALFLYIRNGSFEQGSTILLFMIVAWGLRLGGFLFYRIQKMDRDDRFDSFRGSKKGFLKFWLLQSVSIWIIALPYIIYLTASEDSKFSWLGLFLWTVGWIIETIADSQKFSFKQRHPAKFMQTGLYKHIRHPNYLGEILVWVGVFVFVYPSLNSFEWLSIVSPIWVVSLLLWISGIPLLEKKARKNYGTQVDFQKYVNRTDRLIPWIY